MAALYVEKDGAYYGLPDVDPWDEARDARNYAGPWPVVAHPPCNRWSRLAPLVQRTHGYVVGEDGGMFAHALACVRAFGGVLEHPAHSLAWAAFGLAIPFSDGWNLTLDGAAVAYVEQDRYGHDTRKPTWLYASGVELADLRFGRRTPDKDEPGWWIRSDKPHERKHGAQRIRGHRASRTPIAFRDTLLDMARSALPRSAGSERVDSRDTAALQ